MANVEKQIVEGAAAVSIASFLRMKENVENIPYIIRYTVYHILQ